MHPILIKSYDNILIFNKAKTHKKKFLTRPLRTFRFFKKALKKLLIGLKWIELHLKNSRDNLASCGISAESCNKAEHRRPTIELFCFRSHVNFEI